MADKNIVTFIFKASILDSRRTLDKEPHYWLIDAPEPDDRSTST
jgi:hypothetical protein